MATIETEYMRLALVLYSRITVQRMNGSGAWTQLHSDTGCMGQAIADARELILAHRKTRKLATDLYNGDMEEAAYLKQHVRIVQRIGAKMSPYGIRLSIGGDPRGCCLKLHLPSGEFNGFGGREDGWCVPC